jgi:hypothetical protein
MQRDVHFRNIYSYAIVRDHEDPHELTDKMQLEGRPECNLMVVVSTCVWKYHVRQGLYQPLRNRLPVWISTSMLIAWGRVCCSSPSSNALWSASNIASVSCLIKKHST